MTGLTETIHAKLADGTRISTEEAAGLYQSTDLFELCELGRQVAARRNGQRTLISARCIIYSNACADNCRRCRTLRLPAEGEPRTLAAQEVADKAAESVQAGLSQIQLVGSVEPDRPYDYYLDLVSALRRAVPGAHIQAFGPAQVGALSANLRLGFPRILADLASAGLDSIREDGADVFDPRARGTACYAKVTGGTWLQVMRDAHDQGLVGGATMLFGPGVGPQEKALHLGRLRDLQEDTGGFSFFAPRPAYRTGNGAAALHAPGGLEALREFAVGSIFLDEIPHVRCYAEDLGMALSQVALQFGADTVAVLVYDDEPLEAGERADRGLPNAPQVAELIRAAGYDVLTAPLDQRPSAEAN